MDGRSRVPKSTTRAPLKALDVRLGSKYSSTRHILGKTPPHYLGRYVLTQYVSSFSPAPRSIVLTPWLESKTYGGSRFGRGTYVPELVPPLLQLVFGVGSSAGYYPQVAST